MSNINDLIIEIQGKIDIYKLKAENQRNKTAMCYEDNTLSYANWILGLHKDTPNTTKTVYLYKNVCEKNDGMYEEYLLLRPDKEIDDDGKTLRTHMAKTSQEDQDEFANNKGLLEDGRNELDRLKGELNENETLRNEKATTSEQILETVKGEQQELSDKKTLMEGLQDKLNEINTHLSKQQRELREKEGELSEKEGELSEKEEERDNIMSSLKSIQRGDDDDDDEADESNDDIRSADTLPSPNTDVGTEEIAPETNVGTKEIAQDIELDDQRTVLLNEEIEQLDKIIEPLQKEVNRIQANVSGLEEQFTQINTEIQEVGIATLEGTIQGQLGDIQTLTQELTELNKQCVSINNNITLLDPIVNELGKAIDTHKENFANKPNKLYEIQIKDFENDDVKAIDVLNADYIDIGLLYEDLAYMVGKTRTQDPVIPSESVTNIEAASQSDTDSDTVSISDINIVTAADDPPYLMKLTLII